MRHVKLIVRNQWTMKYRLQYNKKNRKEIENTITENQWKKAETFQNAYLLTLPLFVGVSRVRALSPAWTGSHARETLISRTHLFLLHDLPPTKKSSTIKILTYILRSIFLEIPHLELPRWWKTQRDTNGKGV
jgi:hypothetical protein